mgnify:CR=1
MESNKPLNAPKALKKKRNCSDPVIIYALIINFQRMLSSLKNIFEGSYF